MADQPLIDLCIYMGIQPESHLINHSTKEEEIYSSYWLQFRRPLTSSRDNKAQWNTKLIKNQFQQGSIKMPVECNISTLKEGII